MAAILQQDYMRKMGENEREWEFWHNRVAVKTWCQNEERGLPFKVGKEERPLLDELQVSPIQEREPVKGGELLGF